MGKEWRFTQLGGSRRTITLAGRSAPHGRPRKGPVVSDGIKLRRQRVYYPDGGARPPTTHIFGIEWKDWELQGRFSDEFLGKGTTSALIEQWQAFVADGQDVEISWGDVVNARGIIDSFEPGRESEFESTYKIVILIDERAIFGGFVQSNQIPAAPSALAADLQGELDSVAKIPSLPNAGDLLPSFLDALDDLVSSANSISASMINIAGEIDSFAEGTLDQLERLRAGIAQMRTAVNKIRGTMESTANDAALLSQGADAEVQWLSARTGADVSTMRMLAILDEMDREAEIARRGTVLAVYEAKLGDTFESIASKFYGGPDGAAAIRDANGVRYGELPTPGRSYSVPVAG